MFCIYLILNGIERFLVETIRVNTTYSIFGIHPTQAELISTALVAAGLIGIGDKPGRETCVVSQVVADTLAGLPLEGCRVHVV